MFKTPILMLKMTFFWLLFRGKFEQKTQKSISFKNQWRLKNIKKAMVVKNIIAEDMPFTKSIFEQFWRSYCKKTIFVVFHFLKFLPWCHLYTYSVQRKFSSKNLFSQEQNISVGRSSENLWCTLYLTYMGCTVCTRALRNYRSISAEKIDIWIR